MTAVGGFETMKELVADDRARIPLGKLGVAKNDRYAVSVNPDGTILLTPVVSIPKREAIVWKNSDLQASVLRGLADAAEGKAHVLDWVLD